MTVHMAATIRAKEKENVPCGKPASPARIPPVPQAATYTAMVDTAKPKTYAITAYRHSGCAASQPSTLVRTVQS